MQIRNSEPRHGARGTAGLSTRFKRGLVAGGVVAAAATVFALSPPLSPAVAQLKAEADSVQTPFGRAPLTFADIVEKVKPAVVSISVTNGQKQVAKNDRKAPGGFPNLPDDHPLNDFFKNLPKEFQGGPKQRQQPSLAQGSGFVITEDGYVVTNNHVIDSASEIQVTFDEDNKHDAELVGTDPRTDLALLKIKSDGEKFPFVKFANKPARVGDWVIAVGNPFGLGGTVTAGILSALSRDIGSGPYDFIQIDAAVNRGNSGGPTFNLNGEVIGVNTAIFSPSGGNVGIAFAVPANTATEVINQLRSDGTVSRGWLGVKIQNIDEDTAASLGLEKPKGALVSEVTPSGPAEKSGLEVQDAIVSVNGSAIEDSRDLARKIASFSPGKTVDVDVWRNSAKKSIKVELGRFPATREELAALEQGEPLQPKETELDQLGLSLMPLTGEAAADGDGVAISSVDGESDAARKGLKKGDVILEVQGVEVKDTDDVVEGIKQAKEKGRPAVLMHIRSGTSKRFVAVQLKKKG